MFLAFFLKKPVLSALTAGTLLIAGIPAIASADDYNYDRASHYRTGDSGSAYRREPTTASHYWDHVARAYGARDYGYGYYRSCGCYRGYYSGHRYRNYGPELYDYSAQVFDDRARLDRRTPYEYRWPRRNY
jgi:hypothetical protein